MLDKYALYRLPTHTSKFHSTACEIERNFYENGRYSDNVHSGCWTNALQPLWIAGKVMSHYSEHAAIIETLMRIEREIGWATAWRVEDLKEFWGDYDNDDEYDVDMN